MKAFPFSFALVLVAVAVGALLGWLGYLFIAVAVSIAVVVLGEVAYWAVRMGSHEGRHLGGQPHPQT